MNFYFLIYFNIYITEIAANTIRLATLIVLPASQRRCMVNNICCTYSNYLLMMNSYSIQNM